MKTPSSAVRQSQRGAVKSALGDWMRTDGLTLIYMLKVVLAALLALWIAMRLQLPQPRTAMTTIFVLMQPQSGMVLAKSFYRFCGTLVGLVVMIVFIGWFSQQPVLFLTATALWVGICTAGAARNRHFRSYSFVLAGYTAALVGIPAVQHPDGAFLSAITRAAEVSLGIVCSGTVSALVFPQHAGEAIKATMQRRFGAFVDYVSNALSGKMDRSQIESATSSFIADIVGFEAIRSVAVFEHPDTRMRSGRFARLNTEFMSASTRFHALHQLMNRLHEQNALATIHALQPYFYEVAPLLKKSGEPVLNARDATQAAAQLDNFKTALPKRIRATRAEFKAKSETSLLEFDTAAELLYRFVDDLHSYTQTYASLAVPSHERERWVAQYIPKTNLIAAAVAGLRAVAVILVLSDFWISTAWPSGGTLVLAAATVCGLASSSPRPTRMAFQMAGGTALASVAGLIVMFWLYPRIDGFPLLCATLTPFLLLGTYLTTRRSLVGYGLGYCIFFCFLAGPDNLIHYDPTALINDAIALVCSMLVVSIAFAVILPTDAPWLRRLLLGELRRQVVMACHGRLTRLAVRFESGARDMLSQIHALAGDQVNLKRDALRWLFVVLEVGHAVVDLRTELSQLAADPRYVACTAWRHSTATMLDVVGRLFDKPNYKRFDAALSATDHAIAGVQALLDAVRASREEHRRLRRVLSNLHFIRTALLDPQSPFESFVGARGAPEETHHAT
ncbi:fusaric acid resistance protein [Paraburkholderia phytofirmans OLGA172]|uniref:Fusaric acid resistance protein n=1 Tax=Paraburkholderia phytofirmans OLGA172 TaxID=1417228 RepID=A0A160FJ75_9BURK|nr:FUSC family protein [Paraburkholderia phytofirmans]ANB72204.1 fusaric acid resistance protein [Paraburkholderia phytofirmans OLGA172]